MQADVHGVDTTYAATALRSKFHKMHSTRTDVTPSRKETETSSIWDDE